MRADPSDYVDKGRIRTGPMASDTSYGTTGAFHVRIPSTDVRLSIIASSDDGWEHVSAKVYAPRERTPTWAEMAWVKDQFWTPAETVMQLHVPESDHVNNNQHVLHLWKPTEVEVPRPPAWMVGVRDLGVLA